MSLVLDELRHAVGGHASNLRFELSSLPLASSSYARQVSHDYDGVVFLGELDHAL